MASNAKALSFLSGDLSLSGTEVSINVAGSVQSDSITGSTITMKNTGSTIVASDGTTAVLSESGGTVTLTADEANVGSNALVVDSSGNVGVGTSPDALLDVENSATPKIRVGDGIRHVEIRGGSTTQNPAIGTYYGGDMTFVTDSTERMRIDSSGKLLLGTTNDTGVAGTGAKIKSGAIGSTTEAALVLEGTGGDFYAMRTIGNNMHLISVASATTDFWHIRSTSASGIVIYENGEIALPEVYNDTVTSARDLFIQNGGKIGYVSSIRSSKTNIEDLPSIDWLYNLNPVKFQYRTKDENNNYTDEAEPEIQYGFIAEDVVEVNSDLVFGDETENGFELRGIQYSRLIAPMIKAIQEQQALIESQQSQIDTLTAKTQEQDLTIASLISRIEALENA